VVAAVSLLTHRRASEFAAPEDESGVEEPAGFEILQQAGDRFIDGAAKFRMVLFDV
jgi:hypothetical protein